MGFVDVALVGIGGFGRYMVPLMLNEASLHGARLVACVDPFPENSPYIDAIRSAHIPVYDSLEAFFSAGHADLVVLSTPIHLHHDQAILALSKGCDVLCEKPICSTVQDALEMEAAEGKRGRLLHIGYQWSHSSVIQHIKRDIQAGRFGKPIRLKTLICWPRPDAYFARSWAAKVRGPHGEWILDSIAMNATAHYIHNMFYILGPSVDTSAIPLSFEAELYRANPIETYDTAAFRIQLLGNVSLLYLATHTCDKIIEPEAEYTFTKGTLRLGDSTNRHFIATFSDGSSVDYGIPDGSADKLWNAISARRGEAVKLCGVQAALPHLTVVNAATEFAPVHSIASGSILRNTERGLNYVPDLADQLFQCYSAGRLPYEAGLPFACPPVNISLNGYKRFQKPFV